MFEEIDKLKKELDDLRPLSPQILQLISQKFREEWTYNTNALEGNTMSLHETAFFLREGLTIKGKTLKEHLEVINHSEAIEFLEGELKNKRLTERFIKDIHAILFQGVKPEKGEDPVIPGVYKQKDNKTITLSGDLLIYTPAIQVPSEMENLLNWYESCNEHPIKVAAEFHHKIASIHPFSDGNGRVSRICMNFILMKHGYPPAIIRKEERIDYLKALTEADNGNGTPFLELITKEVKNSLKVMIGIIK